MFDTEAPRAGGPGLPAAALGLRPLVAGPRIIERAIRSGALNGLRRPRVSPLACKQLCHTARTTFKPVRNVHKARATIATADVPVSKSRPAHPECGFRFHDRHYLEVIKGYQGPGGSAQLQAFLNALAPEEVIAFEQSAAGLDDVVAGDPDRIGQPIGRRDPMIAALAITHGWN